MQAPSKTTAGSKKQSARKRRNKIIGGCAIVALIVIIVLSVVLPNKKSTILPPTAVPMQAFFMKNLTNDEYLLPPKAQLYNTDFVWELPMRVPYWAWDGSFLTLRFPNGSVEYVSTPINQGTKISTRTSKKKGVYLLLSGHIYSNSMWVDSNGAWTRTLPNEVPWSIIQNSCLMSTDQKTCTDKTTPMSEYYLQCNDVNAAWVCRQRCPGQIPICPNPSLQHAVCEDDIQFKCNKLA